MLIEIVSLILLLILSGIFSGSETALVDLSIGRVEGLVKEGRPGSKALLELKLDPSRMLTAILIGNNIVNISASVLATVIATRYFGSAGPGIAVGALTVVILIFGEITPKSLATRYAERISLFISPPLLLFMRLIYPLVWIFGVFTRWVHKMSGSSKDPTVTEMELISMLGHGEKEGTIESTERKIIERVFEFNDLTVRDVMTPHNDIFSLDGDLTVAEALPLVIERSYSRIPLYDGSRDNLNKVLYMRDLLSAVASDKGTVRLKDIGHTPVFVSQYQPIDELFNSMRKKRHMSIVVDEHGVIRGVATMEDLLEELVGEIYDESDQQSVAVKKMSENELILDAAEELRVIEDYFHLDLPGKPTDTISLWILTHCESIPQENEVFTIDCLEVTILKATPRQVDLVKVRRLAEYANN
jgi:CBS domain containing-hemolysin-like protein